MENEKAIIIAEERKPSFAELLINQAIEKGLDITVLERLMALRDKLKAENAKEAFDEAMANFQAECPVIEKEKEVKFDLRGGGKAGYSYAPMDVIVEQVKDLLGKNGLSYSFKTEEIQDKGIKAICIAKHKLGHFETGDFTADMAGTSMMSSAQVTASKTTYAKRQAFCNVFGITTGDSDTDALKTKEEAKIEAAATKIQKEEIDMLTNQAKMTVAEVAQKVRDHYGVSITDLTITQAMGVIVSLKKKIEENSQVK